MLKIENLHVAVGGHEILKGLSLEVPAGEVHAVMGPNGSGKSTLSFTLAGREDYEVTAGDVTLEGEDLLQLAANERAAKGVFLSFQNPMEIPGVATMNFIRTALNAQRKTRGEEEVSAADFLKLIREKGKLVGLSDEKLKRPFNVGFSGGEKKRGASSSSDMNDPPPEGVQAHWRLPTDTVIDCRKPLKPAARVLAKA